MSRVDVYNDNKLGVLKILLSSLIAVIASLVLILIFALLIKWFEWGDNIIAPVNIAIKILSIAIGVLVATKNGGRALAKGSIIGGAYVLLSYVVFSALLGNFSLSIGNLWDLVFGVITGGIVGIICNVIHK